MNYPKVLIAALSIGVFSQALAVDPAKTDSPVAAAAETQSNADAQAKADADAKAKAKAMDSRLRSQGYKPVNTNGTLRYCRSEQALGSRFEHSVCGTPEELDFAEKQGKETVQKIQQNNSSLPSGK